MRMAAPAIPYLAVLVGLHLVDSGLIAALSYHMGICAVILASGRWRKIKRALGGSSWKGYLLFVPPCLATGVAIYLLWPVAQLPGVNLGDAMLDMGLNDTTWPAVVIYSCTVNPLLEELYWREYLGSDLRRPVVHDVLFGGYHALVLVLFLKWYFVVIAVACLVVAAWLWRQVRARYGGLAIPIAGHIAADASILFAISRLG